MVPRALRSHRRIIFGIRLCFWRRTRFKLGVSSSSPREAFLQRHHRCPRIDSTLAPLACARITAMWCAHRSRAAAFCDL